MQFGWLGERAIFGLCNSGFSWQKSVLLTPGTTLCFSKIRVCRLGSTVGCSVRLLSYNSTSRMNCDLVNCDMARVKVMIISFQVIFPHLFHILVSCVIALYFVSLQHSNNFKALF